MSLRHDHFQNAARGPLKYVGPGPSAPHFENVHFEQKLERAATSCLHRYKIGLVRPSAAAPYLGASAAHFENDDFEKN